MGRKTAAGWRTLGLVLMGLAVTVGVSLAQAQDPPAKAEAPAKATKPGRKGGLRAPGGAGAKAKAKIGQDPLAKAAADHQQDAPNAGNLAPGTFHYTMKLVSASGDTTVPGNALSAAYYPSKLGTGAPVVLMVHERERSSKDFQDPIADLKNKGIAEALQAQNYAVLLIDLRGHGANPRRNLSARDWASMADDLQTAYRFLIGRHNYGEFNVSRLGVVALGEGANVALNWAAMSGGVPSEGMPSDLNALVAVSPMIDAQAQGLPALSRMRTLAARIPLCIMAGERDNASIELVKVAQPIVTRVRSNKVQLFPSSLHGYKLMRLEPKFTDALIQFLDGTIKSRATEWEGRYNWTPVLFDNIRVVRNSNPAAAKTQ